MNMPNYKDPFKKPHSEIAKILRKKAQEGKLVEISPGSLQTPTAKLVPDGCGGFILTIQ